MYGNPSSAYSFGQQLRKVIDEARQSVADLLGARSPDEIVFTSCGTESDNWAILGALESQPEKEHIITTRVEHEAVRKLCQNLDGRSHRVTWLDVDEDGSLDTDALISALDEKTAIVSVMLANNETGILFPVDEICKIVKKRSNALFHVDGVNAVGKVPIDVNALGCGLLSLSGHKIYGPKGVGALYGRKGIRIRPFMEGGGQESGKRSGTWNVPGIVGLGKALEIAAGRLESDAATWTRWRDRIIDAVLALPDTVLNGSREHRLPFNVNVSFHGTEGEPMLLGLDELGFCVSSGAACSSGSTEPSHVLTAMGLSREWAQGSLRITLGRSNDDAQVDRLLVALPEVVSKLRSLNPSYGRIPSPSASRRTGEPVMASVLPIRV